MERRLISGVPGEPDRVFLLAAGKRHWIHSPHLFEGAGLDWARIERGGAHHGEPGEPLATARSLLAALYLRGDGAEIGALHNPSPLPSDARAIRIDLITPEQQRKLYPDAADGCVPVDLIDDGETLERVPDASLDFIVANHFLEHTRNVLGVLETHRRKLRPGGVLMYALPNKDHTFDRQREITPFWHLVRDYEEGPLWNDDAHFLDFATHVDGLSGDAAAAHAAELKRIDCRIHFHVWDADATEAMFEKACAYLGGLELVCFMDDAPETVAVLRAT